MRRVLLWFVATGCSFAPHALSGGRDGSTGSDSGGDAGTPDAVEPIDALDVDRDCRPLWQDGSIAFYPPVPIAELDTSAVERDPFLSPDELTIYFSREVTLDHSDADIFTATRAQIGAAFGSAAPFTPVNTTDYESKMSISGDGTSLVVCRGTTGTGENAFLATRTGATQPWSTLTTAHMNNVNDLEAYDPELGSDTTQLYDAPSNGVDPQTLALYTRDNYDDDFELGDIPGYTPDTDHNDADPWVDADQQLLVFSRVMVGGNDVDLYYAAKAGAAELGTPAPVPDVNSVGEADSDPWVSPKGCRVYFSSTRNGNFDLFVANAK